MKHKKLLKYFSLEILYVIIIGSVVMVGGAAWIESLPPHPDERQEVIEYYPAIRK